MLSVLVAWSVLHCAASSLSVDRCDPSGHICHGPCPSMPPGAPVPDPASTEGLCLLDSSSDACACWHWNPSPDQYLQTLLKCDLRDVNGSLRHSMCLPPPYCFPPGSELGCLIVPFCPCRPFPRGPRYGTWHSVVATIFRSNVPVEPTRPEEGTTEAPNGGKKAESSSGGREFNLKHLLFLLAFVIAPLCCWCLLTFFHEGKCRKKLGGTVARPVSIRARCADESDDLPELAPPAALLPPTAPKLESPPPYREANDPETSLLPSECGPPPSYEDAVQCQWRLMVVPSVPEEPDSD